MNCGSVDSLNVSARCGLRPKSCQIRPIVDFDSPDFSAIDVRDQWVALRGVCSRVATTTSSTLSTAIDGGRPGRCSSISPSRRSARKRRRHLPTVDRWTFRDVATSVFEAPSAHARMILARIARTCADFARRDHRVNVVRSSSVKTSGAVGRPVRAIAPPYTDLLGEFPARNTRQEASTTSDDLQPAGLADEYALHEYALLPVEASSVEVV